MDKELTRLERLLAAHPGSAAIEQQMARCLRRAGQVYDARQLLRRSFAAGRFDLAGMELFLELGRQAGFLGDDEARRSSLLNVSGLLRGGGTSELEVEIGYAGIEGAGALQSVLALADAFAYKKRRNKKHIE